MPGAIAVANCDVLELDPSTVGLRDLTNALRNDLACAAEKPGNTYWVRHAHAVAVELERRIGRL